MSISSNALNHLERAPLSWASIMGGVVVSLSVMALFNLLGLGLGLSTLGWNSNLLMSVSIGSFTWLFLTNLFANLSGGWVAGYFARTTCRMEAAIHGFVSWSLAATLLLLLAATVVGGLISGVASIAGQGLSLAGRGATQVVSGAMNMDMDKLKEIRKSLPPELESVVADIEEKADNLLETAVSKVAKNLQQETEEKLKNQFNELLKDWISADQPPKQKTIRFLTDKAGLSQKEASELVESWDNLYEAGKQQVMEKGAKTSKGLGASFFTLFLMLLSGSLASAGGGAWATKKAVKA